jgi:hypothetical protein
VDQEGTTLARNKQKLNDGLGFGNFTLPKNLPGAVYILRAYTIAAKGFDCLVFKKELPVFNRIDLRQQLAASGLTVPDSACNGELTSIREGNDLKIHMSSDIEGTIIAYSKGIVLFNHDLSTINFPYVVDNVTANEIAITILDKNQELRCETVVPASQPAGYSFYVDYNAVVSANDNASVTLTLRDSLGDEAGGNFSMSIRRRSEVTRPEEEFFDGTIRFSELQKIGDFRALASRERYLYPKHPGSLQPLKFAEKFMGPQIKEAAHTFALTANEVDRYKLISRIDSAYGNHEMEYEHLDTHLPFDNTYTPDDFQTLPTFEDFFTEIIRQGRIKRTKGRKMLILRNTENKNAVYNYKGNPLIMVDGYISTNLDAILNLDPALIRRINLTWKVGTLSDAAIASLADNGILAIYSKSGSLATGVEREQGIYDGFHIPFSYSALNREKQNKSEMPVLSDLLYWNPVIELRGRQKLTFFTSDDLGEYVVDIVGVAYTGELIRKRITFEVRSKH